MLGIANKPTSVFNTLSLPRPMRQSGRGDLGMPGDVYIITDTRKNPRKELDQMRSLLRYGVKPYTPETTFACESGTVLFPVKDLNFDRKNFQNRETDFSDESVLKIIKAVKDGKFNWAVFDAITIWQNPSDGKFYVLSGHSRSEAFKRLAEMGESADSKDFLRIPAKIFKGTLDEARDLALNSNTLSTKETNFERANYYRALYNSEIAKGRSKAEATNLIMPVIKEREGKNANSIFYMSFLNPNGIFYDALRQLQNAPTQDRERLKVVGEWVGRLRKDRSKLTDFHERELFDYLITQGNYNKTVTNYADLLKRIDTALLKMVDEKGNFQPERSLNLKRNIVAEGNEKAFLQELDRLKRVAADDENLYNQKLAEFRNRQKVDSTITDELILKAVEPYRQRAVLSKADYNAFRQKRAQYIDADRRQTSLFGLGKPTVKFEFEDNADLFNFFAKKNDYSNAQNVDFENVATSTASTGKRGASRTQSAITTPDTLYLPYSEGSKPLPGSANPKSLPPASQNIPPLTSVLKPDGVYINHRKIGDYGYINDKLKFINFYIDKEYMVNDNIFKWSERIFPHAVIIICFQDSNGIWKFFFQRPKYKNFIYKKFPNSFFQNSGIKYFIFDFAHIEKVIQAFEGEGYPVVLVYRNIVEDINDIPQPSSPKALPPSGIETDETFIPFGYEKETVIKTPSVQSPNFNDYERRFANASGWASFDPEQSAKSNVGAYKELYNYYVQLVDPSKVDAFNNYFDTYVNNLISARSRTANVAVTGGGGISASKARKLNAASDRYMEMSANFKEALEDFVKKLNRSARRAEFVQMSNEERSDERFNELKKVVDSIATSQENYKKYKKEPALMPQEDYEFYLKHYNVKDKKEAIAWALNSIQYNVGLDKAGLYDKIYREYRNGNNLTVNRILDYIKSLNIFTDKHKIWKLYNAVANKPDFETSLFDTQKNYEGAEIFENRELDRVQIKFAGIPSEDCRTDLKSNGFRWSPYYKVWQRKLTPQAVRVANEIVAKYYSVGLGKPTVKFEFEDNAEIFKTFGSGVSGLTVNDKPAALFNCPESLLQCKGFTPTYTRLEDYSCLIEPAKGEKKLVGYGFEVSTLNELANACNHYNDVARLASHLKADNVLQSAFNVWHWLHTNIKYNYDTPGEEEIRTPARSWADRENGVDCDCIAVFTACLLGAMGYKPKFEIVAFNNSPKYSHIYVNLDGAAIDRVLPVFLARPENITKTKIMDIPVFELSGTADGGFSTLNGIYADTLLKVNSGTANAQDSMDLRKTQVLLGLQKSDPQAYKLAAILMPYVVAIDDNGSYYFANDKVAEIAENADKKLYSLKISGANQAAFDEFFNSIVGEMKNISVRLERGNGKTIVTISFTNPQNDTYNVEGEYVKKDMLAINPDFLTMRNALKNLIAVNYYDLATRFAVGLMTEKNAVQAGYTPETWQKAVEATNKLKKLWTLLGGDVETLIQVIESGAEKEAVVEVDGDTSIIETSAFDSVLHGCKYNALSGINGLGETSTVNSELDTLGEGFEKLLEWVAEIEPGETVNISITKTSDGDSNIRYASTMPQNGEKKNKAWLWLLGGAVVGGGIAAATSGKKYKKSKR